MAGWIERKNDKWILTDLGIQKGGHTVGKHFNVSSQRFNLLMNELGWIEKTIAGWRITSLGKNMGGKQFEHETSVGTYVHWPENILTNKNILELFEEKQYKNSSITVIEKSDSESVNDFRKTYPAEYRTKDGHYVRS